MILGFKTVTNKHSQRNPAGAELEKYAIGPLEMSNLHLEKPKIPQHKPESPWQDWWLPTHFAASLACTARTVSRNKGLNDKCHKVASFAQPA